jgi:serine/threonine protein kinase
MGAVYSAVQKSLERTVAIKILPREFSRDAAFRTGFEAEAKAMARLNHPNLIGVYDFGEVNGMLYIIMEYVPGQSLFHSAHGIAIDPNEVIRLITGICHGLAHAHSNGIIHRDIKPSNILLDLKAQPKIGDFGLARPIERTVAHDEEIFGTPHYTAPEVVNSPQSVDYRADIFSVGVLLHELLTGRLPTDDPRPASVIIHCDPRFDAIIRRATDPLPERRYTSAAGIANDLRPIVASGSPQKLQPTPDPKPPRNVSARSKPTVIPEKESSNFPGIVMLVLAIIIGFLTYKHFAKPSPSQKNIPTQPIPTIPEPATPSTTTPKPPAKPPAKPAPKPDAPSDPNPMPDPDPDPTTTTDSTNGFTLPEQPKSDVAGFLTRAQKIMQDRAAPLLTKYHTQIKDNSWFFEKSLLLCAGKLGTGRVQAIAQIKKTIESWQSEGARMPATLEDSLAEIPGVPEAFSQALEKQTAIDNRLQQELIRLAPTYIRGLEKQIERLKTANDPLAIDLIQEEITKTRDDAQYFPGLLLGNDAPKEKPSDEYEYPKDP